jgi:predicted acyl esterase
MREMKSEVCDGMRIDWDVSIPSHDGTLLAADVFRPDDDGQYPVLLAAGPYAKGLPFQQGYVNQWENLITNHADAMTGSSNKYQVWEFADPEQWVPHGYVLVRVDTRGTGNTPGNVSFYDHQETKDLYAAVEWAGTQPWSSGKVGLSGISYMATNQWQVAAMAPPHLAAICPWEGANDYYREYARSGGIVSEFLPSWMPVQVAPYQYGNPDAPVNPMTGRRVTGDEDVPEDVRKSRLIDLANKFNEHLLDDEFYRERSAELEKVNVPLLSSGNWGGVALHLRGNIEGFTRAATESKWLEIHGLEHWTEYYVAEGRELQKRFFDHFLKGEDNGWDQQPPIKLKVRHVDDFVVRHEYEWPIARTQWTDYYLNTEDISLSTEPAESSSSATFEARSKGLSFRTAPFEEETEITGPVVLKLLISSSTEDADIFATLSLYDPEGNEVLYPSAMEPNAPLTQGWLRASQRKTDPERSLPWRPWHSHDAVEKLTPDEAVDLDVEIWPTSIVVPPGYTLGLTVQGQDYDHGLPNPKKHYGRPQTGSGPYWHEHPGDRDKPEFSGHTTIVSEPGHEPRLILPIIPKRESE